jgi:hypothetical protein
MTDVHSEGRRRADRPLVVLSLSRTSATESHRDEVHYVRFRRRLFDRFGESIVLREIAIDAVGRLDTTRGLAVAERMIASGEVDVVVAENPTRISRSAARIANFARHAIVHGVSVHFLDG